MNTFPVPIPYEGDQPLVLERHSTEGFDPLEVEEWMSENVSWDSTAFERIMRSAVILHAANPTTTFEQCISTAIIWECG